VASISMMLAHSASPDARAFYEFMRPYSLSSKELEKHRSK
jgi:hypothetical protein